MAKAIKKQVLGRGLSAILDESKIENSKNEASVGSIVLLEMTLIETNPFQPRSHFHEESLTELSNSIKELGVIQPITVRKLDHTKFQLVSGERRFRASKIIGNKTIPAYIRTANDQEMLEMALVENIQRKNLDPIEIALSYQRLVDEIKLTQEELSKRVGKKRSTVTNYLRLLKLDPIIQTGIRDGFLSMGHGRALIGINSLKDQLSIYEQILKENMSVRQTEILIKNYREPKKKQKSIILPSPSFVKLGLPAISKFFGDNISIIANKKGKGKISIPFNSEEEFNRIKKLLE